MIYLAYNKRALYLCNPFIIKINMKKYLLFIVILTTSLSSTQAQLLWKVTGNGLKQPSYLFGTHHLIPIQFLDSVPGIYTAFNDCKMIVGEIVLNSIDITSKIEKAAIMPNQTKIADLLSKEKYKLVNDELELVLKMGLKELSIMNPTLILTLYKTELYKKTTGLTDDKQADSYFQMIAEEKGKKVVGLETIDEQIKILFGNSTLIRQAEILAETIENKQNTIKDMMLIDSLYKSGKINELTQLAQKTEKKLNLTDDEYSQLVDVRNANWMTKLPNLMTGSSCFICVGALHLGGNKGLIRLLEKKGFRVKALNPEIK